ncbi:hypothetical protein [Bradyrhizobium sp. USDA 4510]
MNSAARVSHCGEAVAAWPLTANDSPTQIIAVAVRVKAAPNDGLRQAIAAISIAAIASSSAGNRLVARGAGPCRPRHDARERQVQEVDTLQAKRRDRADKADLQRPHDQPFAGRALPDPGRKEHAADAGKQAQIEPEPRQPDQHIEHAVA